MYRITAKTPVTGAGYGLAFVNGVATTDKARIAEKLKSKGYTVEELGAGAADEAAGTEAKADAKAFAMANDETAGAEAASGAGDSPAGAVGEQPEAPVEKKAEAQPSSSGGAAEEKPEGGRTRGRGRAK